MIIDEENLGAEVPIGDVLPGILIEALPDHEEIGFVFALVKYVEKSDQPDKKWSWAYRTASSISDEELLGVLRIQANLLERSLTDDWFEPVDNTEGEDSK